MGVEKYKAIESEHQMPASPDMGDQYAIKKNIFPGKHTKGFTLIEVLVALAISGIVLSAAYVTYRQQLRSYKIQESVAVAQQNLRAAMFHLERDLRLAGLDPSGKAGAGFITVTRDELSFTRDIGGGAGNEWFDGDTEDSQEEVRYAINSNGALGREWGGNGGLQPLAENADALDFVYLDENGDVIDQDGLGSVTTRLSDIRSVIITLIIRGETPDKDFQDQAIYTNSQGREILNTGADGYRRRMLSSHIRCRNLGL